jgi:hypothetical protein
MVKKYLGDLGSNIFIDKNRIFGCIVEIAILGAGIAGLSTVIL